MAAERPGRGLKATTAGAALFCLATLVLAYVSYAQFEADYRHQTQARLEAIAELKAKEVAAWRRERVADGRYFIDNRSIVDLSARLLRGEVDAAAQLRDALRRMQENHRYQRIAYHDAEGTQRLAVPDDGGDSRHMQADVVAAIAAGQLRFLDLHDSPDGLSHMAIIAPLSSTPNGAGRGPGAMVLRIDAQQALSPFLTTWPMPETTAQTLLVRRDGDEVVYLNAVLGLPGGDAPARVPITRTDLPAVRAVMLGPGAVEARDRRGVEVVAAALPIADSPWFLLAAQARQELYGPIRERALVTITMVVLLLIAGMAGLGFVWRGHTRRLAAQEHNLLETLKAMAQVVEASPVVVFRWSAAAGWPVEWVSANVARWGYTPEQLIAGTPHFAAIIHPDDVDRVNAEVAGHTAQGSDAFVQEYRVCTADGRVLWVDDRTTVVRDAAGRAVRYDGTLTDITERKDLQAKFVQAQKMETVGRLAGGVAHDFNNLLTVINGYAEFALSELPDDDPVRGMVKEIADAGTRAAALTQQLLAFSRRQVVQRVSLNLNDSAELMQKMLQRLIGEDIRLTFDLDPAVWPVRADAAQVEQVIMNLAVNARDAMPEGGTLVVTTRNVVQDGDWVMLAVADTGCGMDEATQQRIFEPFFTTKKAGQGTGLGLATVYGIVSDSGGRIEVSSAVGHGTTFRIYLPRDRDGGVEGAGGATQAGMVPGRGERVLVVEDEEALRRIAQRILESAGYQVWTAADGAHALQVLADLGGEIDLLLTDVVMPGMSGHELAGRVTATYPRLRVLFASGYLHDAFPDRARLGADVEFVAKPYTPTSLSRRVRDVLDRP